MEKVLFFVRAVKGFVNPPLSNAEPSFRLKSQLFSHFVCVMFFCTAFLDAVFWEGTPNCANARIGYVVLILCFILNRLGFFTLASVLLLYLLPLLTFTLICLGWIQAPIESMTCLSLGLFMGAMFLSVGWLIGQIAFVMLGILAMPMLAPTYVTSYLDIHMPFSLNLIVGLFGVICFFHHRQLNQESQRELSRSKERYRSMIMNQTEFIVRWLPDGTRTFVNQKYCDYFGLDPVIAVGTSFMSLISEEHREAIRQRTERLTPENPIGEGEHLVLLPDGEQRWNWWTDKGIFDEQGQLVELQSVGRDIHERREAQKHLEVMNYSIEHAGIPVLWVVESGEIIYGNLAAYELFGYTAETFRTANFSQLCKASRENWPFHWARLRDAGESDNEVDLLTCDEKSFPASVHVSYFHMEDKQFLFMSILDLTELYKAQDAVFEERQRLARDLHDSVTQSLYGLTLLAEASQRKASGHEKADFSRLGEIGRQALKEMRLLIFELMPGAFENEGLIGALQHRLETVEKRTYLGVDFQWEGDFQDSIEFELELYHIAMEALNNSLKHSRASQVEVRLTCIDGKLELFIKDNGDGFCMDKVSGGLGLNNMRTRAEKLNGKLVIDSAPGKGTKVSVLAEC